MVACRGGTPDETLTATWATCVVSEDKDAGRFYKFKDNALTAAIGYLREKGLFQDDSDSESGDNPAADLSGKQTRATQLTRTL